MNQLTIVGTIKEVPNFKTTSTGLNFANILVQSNRITDKNIDEFQITFWNQNLDYIKNNISNGDKVYIKAHLKSNNFNKENKETLYRNDIIGEKIHLIN